MITKEVLKEIVKSQRNEYNKLDLGIIREKKADIDLSLPFAIIISGVRRCGKSTLLRQLSRDIKNYFYFNFEDTRLVDFEASDFSKLYEVFVELYGDLDYFILDEVQNVPYWELFVRENLDRKKKFLITGSNASLLSRELGTRLTGRYLSVELFPFNYSEFLKFVKKKPNISSFYDFLNRGGFPEYLKYGRLDFLQQLFRDILYRDIVQRYKVKETSVLQELAIYLVSNVGKEWSYQSLKKQFNLGSVNTVIAFINYLENAYLFFSVPRFDYSLKKQKIAPKKIYAVDNGLITANTKSFTKDEGRLLENCVFLQLRRKYKEIYYFKTEKGECDFIVKDRNEVVGAYQVCLRLTQDNQDREINTLLDAMTELKLDYGLILTLDQEDHFEYGKKKIEVMPVWKWLLKK